MLFADLEQQIRPPYAVQVHSRRGRCQAFIVRAENRPIIIGLAADSGKLLGGMGPAEGPRVSSSGLPTLLCMQGVGSPPSCGG